MYNYETFKTILIKYQKNNNRENLKMNKEDFTTSIDEILKNENKIDLETISYSKKGDAHWLLLYPFCTALLIFGYQSLVPFFNIEHVKLLKLTYALGTIAMIVTGIFTSCYLSNKITDLVFKGKNKLDKYSVSDLVFKTSLKDFKKRNIIMNDFNDFIRKKLPKSANKVIRKEKIKNIMKEPYDRYGINNSISYSLIKLIKDEYSRVHSEEQCMQDLTEYLIHNYDTSKTLKKALIKESAEYFELISKDLEQKRLLMEATKIGTEEEHFEIKKSINKNKKLSKILSI
jgi:hypothetical protein